MSWRVEDVREIINLTTHDIRVRLYGSERVYPPSGKLCQVLTKETERHTPPQVGELKGIPILVCADHYGSILGLPDMVHGVAYLVSKKVIDNLDMLDAYRPDVFAPATNRAHRPILRENEIHAVTALIGTKNRRLNRGG